MKNTMLKIALAAVLAGGLASCAYDSKEYPRESWFGTNTVTVSEKDFAKTESPVSVSLAVTYRWEGQLVDDARLDWHERYGLWLAAKRYLEETGLVKVVEEVTADGTKVRPVKRWAQGQPEDPPPAALLTVVVDRSLSERTKQALARKKQQGSDEKIVYIYDMALAMELIWKDGKRFDARSVTDAMYIGHEDSEERESGIAAERFDFSFFNNMDFHTEFTRRFYRQMIFEVLTELQKERAFRSLG